MMEMDAIRLDGSELIRVPSFSLTLSSHYHSPLSPHADIDMIMI